MNSVVYRLHSRYIYHKFNPETASFLHPKDRKSILFCLWENRNHPYCSMAATVNQLYCQQHGYQFVTASSGYEDIPPFWVKTWYVYDQMLQHPETEFIVWMDSDAVVANHHYLLEQVINLSDPTKLLWISYDPSITVHWLIYKRKTVNTGVFVIRNNEQGRELMQDWKNMFRKEEWRVKDGQWSCNGYYSGRKYEQGALNLLLTRKQVWNKKTSFLPPGYFADDRPDTAPYFIYHLMGETNEIRYETFNRIYNKWKS
jgi:galactosyl transferase GMA12/MNN10 family